MDIKKCFEIFELDRPASLYEVKQAYKDIVNVWHPDRFSNNPRLKQKAEEKLKEINVAYDTLKSYLASKQDVEPEQDKAPQENFKATEDVEVGPKTKPEAYYRQEREESKTYDKTEVIVEAGTGIVLSLWSYLSSIFQRIVADAKTEIEQGEMNQCQRKTGRKGRGRAMGRGRGMGRGKGMGGLRGGGAKGRGRG